MKKLSESILAEGEVTGHAHRLPSDVAVYENDDGEREFSTKKSVAVTHEEHHPVQIPTGKYVSDKVLEYNHFEEQARKVAD